MKKLSNYNNYCVKDSFQAFLVDGAHFTSCEEYPVLPPAMVSSCAPKKIMPFNKAIAYKSELKETFICTYSPDETFERIRRNPQKYVDFFKKTAGIIGFDFSVHSDMPVIKQKAQMYDNLALTYYYGRNGIPIIPNLRCGIDELMPEFFEAVPHNSIVSIGTHGFCKELQEQCEWYCFLSNVISKLSPTIVIVYGSLNGKMFNEFKNSTQFIFYEPWITNNYKERKNGNKRSL